jgi:hypothetical protein
MAVRGWGGSVATAIGAAAGAGAAQLGLAYGLGVIVWLPFTDRAGQSTWVAGLTWALWIAATSTIVGAVCAERLGRPLPDVTDQSRPYVPATLAAMFGRTTLAGAGAIGALVTVALVAVPARAATRADTASPQTIVAGYAVLGVLLGLVAAGWALSSRPAARNLIATVCWLWLLAVVAVIAGLSPGRSETVAQLGVWQITNDSERLWFRNVSWPEAALSVGSALVIGALAARSAARDRHTRFGAAMSGAAGPLLVAAAYFLTAPRLGDIPAKQLSAHLAAPYAVLAGIAGSAIVAALAQRAEATPAALSPPAHPAPPARRVVPDDDNVPLQRDTGRDRAREQPPHVRPAEPSSQDSLS